MKKKLIFILFGVLSFASSSYSRDSFMAYISKYESLEFPLTLRFEPVIHYPKINMTDLETIYGIPKSELYFEMSDYDQDNDIQYNLRTDSLYASFLGYCIADKYIIALISIIRDSYEQDSYSRNYYYVFTKDGDFIERLLIYELQLNDSRRYLFSILYDKTHISTFDYKEDKDNYELVEDRKYGEEFYRKKNPNKPFFYVEKKSYELDENGKFRQTETKKIDLEKSLSYYFDCPIKEDDPMYNAVDF
jgi:hypothetical protein